MNEQNGLPELPPGWVWTTVGEISDLIHYGYTESATSEDTGTKFLRITDIQNNTVDWQSVPFCKIGGKESERYLLSENDLLFARTGATVGKSFLIRGQIPKSIFASYLIRIILSKEINATFVYNFFQSSYYWLQIRENQLGIGQPNVNGTILSTLTLPLPPLPEQSRIVARIEELFTKLDAGVAALRRLQKQLKRYRQAVLRDAVTGELTRQWRKDEAADSASSLESGADLLKRILRERRARWEAAQLEKFAAAGKTPKNDDWKRKYQEPAAPDTANLPELPDGWTRVSIGQIIEDLKYGTSQKCSYENVGVPVLRIPNVGNGVINRSDLKYAELPETEYEQLKLKAGDILLIRSNGSVSLVGKTALVRESESDFAYAGYLIRLRLNPSFIYSGYLQIAFASNEMRIQIELPARSTSGVHNINSDEVKALQTPLPPLAEQQAIVAEVERLLSVADALAQTVERGLKQAARLRQSILKRAFAGRLVAQNERDEPASVLLERIKAERAAKESGERARKAPAKTRKIKKNKAVQGVLPYCFD